jgi:hypothetical protein
MESNAQNGLEYLGPEILSMIVTQLPDLISLDSLLRVSPITFRLLKSKIAVKSQSRFVGRIYSSSHLYHYLCYGTNSVGNPSNIKFGRL